MAWVQGPTPSSSGSAITNGKTFTGSTPAGNLIVVQITQLFGSSAPQSITHVRDNIDGAVNYTLAKRQSIGAGPDAVVDTYYRVVTSTGTRTVTVTFAGAADSSVAVNEYDAAHTVLDVTNGNTGTTGNITPGSVTPPGTALYIAACTNANGVTVTPDAAWDQRQEVESSGISPINVHDKITSGAQNPTTTTGATPGAWAATIVTFIAGSSIEQEGFQFRNDDGSETTATAAGAQDANVTAPLGANLRLRALLNATGDPSSLAFPLYYKRDDEGTYEAVPVGATYPTVTPTYVGGQVAGRAGNTGTASVNFALTGGLASVPAAGDLVIITVVVGSQGRTPACAVSGYTALGQINANGTTYDTSLDVSWKVMGGTPDTSFTLPATGNAQDAQRYSIQVWRGVDATTPMDVTPVQASGTGTGRPNPGSITPTTAQAIILICAGGAAAAGAAYTAPANYTTGFLTGTTADTNDAMVGSGYRATAWTSGAEDPAAYTGGTTNAADSWAAYTLALRPAVVGGNNRLYIATSANITAGGENTTAQLTAPSGKTSGADFVAGRMHDDENGSDSVNLPSDAYSEFEFCLQAQSPAVDGEVYQFRVYAGSNPLDSYTVTPEWTIGSGAATYEAVGALVTDDAVLSGAAVVTNATTGALAAAAANVSGATVVAISSTGALQAGSATLAGVATFEHVATGTLAAGAATLAGTVGITNATTGALQAGSATAAGAAVTSIDATGTLVAGAATLAGAATFDTEASGTLQVGSATLAGVTTTTDATTGALQAGSATLAGAATVTNASTGALAAGAATLAGSALVQNTSSGTLTAGSASITGDASIPGATYEATGALQAGSATLAGSGAVSVASTGALAAGAATVSGGASVINVVDGSLAAGAAQVDGATVTLVASSGALVAGAAQLAGSATVSAAATGALQAGSATLAGVSSVTHTAPGTLAAGAATIAGAALVIFGDYSAEGTLQAGSATMSGAAWLYTFPPTGDRVREVDAENRTLGIEEENRTLGIEEENRTLGIEEENRTLDIEG